MQHQQQRFVEDWFQPGMAPPGVQHDAPPFLAYPGAPLGQGEPMVAGAQPTYLVSAAPLDTNAGVCGPAGLPPGFVAAASQRRCRTRRTTTDTSRRRPCHQRRRRSLMHSSSAAR